MSNHHSFGYSLAHDGEKLEVLDRAVRKERYGGHQWGAGWESDLWTRYWRMRMVNLWVHVGVAAELAQAADEQPALRRALREWVNVAQAVASKGGR